MNVTRRVEMLLQLVDGLATSDDTDPKLVAAALMHVSKNIEERVATLVKDRAARIEAREAAAQAKRERVEDRKKQAE